MALAGPSREPIELLSSGEDDDGIIALEPPASIDKPISAANVGYTLLTKLGWKEGQGLGVANQGCTEPVDKTLKRTLAGQVAYELTPNKLKRHTSHVAGPLNREGPSKRRRLNNTLPTEISGSRSTASTSSRGIPANPSGRPNPSFVPSVLGDIDVRDVQLERDTNSIFLGKAAVRASRAQRSALFSSVSSPTPTGTTSSASTAPAPVARKDSEPVAAASNELSSLAHTGSFSASPGKSPFVNSLDQLSPKRQASVVPRRAKIWYAPGTGAAAMTSRTSELHSGPIQGSIKRSTSHANIVDLTGRRLSGARPTAQGASASARSPREVVLVDDSEEEVSAEVSGSSTSLDKAIPRVKLEGDTETTVATAITLLVGDQQERQTLIDVQEEEPLSPTNPALTLEPLQTQPAVVPSRDLAPLASASSSALSSDEPSATPNPQLPEKPADATLHQPSSSLHSEPQILSVPALVPPQSAPLSLQEHSQSDFRPQAERGRTEDESVDPPVSRDQALEAPAPPSLPSPSTTAPAGDIARVNTRTVGPDLTASPNPFEESNPSLSPGQLPSPPGVGTPQGPIFSSEPTAADPWSSIDSIERSAVSSYGVEAIPEFLRDIREASSSRVLESVHPALTRSNQEGIVVALAKRGNDDHDHEGVLSSQRSLSPLGDSAARPYDESVDNDVLSRLFNTRPTASPTGLHPAPKPPDSQIVLPPDDQRLDDKRRFMESQTTHRQVLIEKFQRATDISERASLSASLRELALADELTGTVGIRGSLQAMLHKSDRPPLKGPLWRPPQLVQKSKGTRADKIEKPPKKNRLLLRGVQDANIKAVLGFLESFGHVSSYVRVNGDVVATFKKQVPLQITEQGSVLIVPAVGPIAVEVHADYDII